MDRIYTIRTPEMVAFEFRVAGLGSRFLAWTIDVVVLAAAITGLVLFVTIAGCIGGLFGVFSIAPGQVAGEVGLALTIVAFFAVYYGYFMFFEWLWSGRTPGKRSLGLRVMQDNGTRIAPFQAIVRNLLRIFDSMAPLYTVGVAVAAATERTQRLGDLVAGTLVVRDDRQTKVPKAKGLAAERQIAFADDPALARRLARRLTNAERELLIDAARRADEIALPVRGPLFERLAKHFAARLEVARDPHLSDEKLVQNLARALLGAERAGLGQAQGTVGG
jgi:uncharacterized RDD family membrane protein YckC